MTPRHSIVETGAVAYCIQPEKDSPYGSGYTEGMGWSAYDSTTRLGFQAILEHGYPNYTGGFTDDQARYATANAIRFWVAERGCDFALDWMDLTRFSQFFRAKSGYEDLYDWCMELLYYARNGSVIRHSASLSAPSVSEEGDYFVVKTTVSLENCNWGYTYDETAMPPDTDVYGYSGSDGDELTLYVPKEYAGYDFDICISAYDNRTSASVLYYGPDNGNQQRVIAYTWDNGEVTAEATETVFLEASAADVGTIRIIKTDSVTGKPLEGVWFYLYGPNNDFYSEPTDENGIIEWKVPPGSYRYKESEPPEGYIGDTTRYRISVNLGEVTEVRVTNDPIAVEEPTGTLYIAKTDYDTVAALSGVEFTVYDSSKNFVTSGTTDSNGKLRIEELPLGSYYYRETKAKDGYVANSNYYSFKLSNDGQLVSVAVRNKLRQGAIHVTKADSDDAPLAGAEYTLESSTDGGTKWTEVSRVMTDTAGKASFTKLAADMKTLYRLTETKAPPGFSLISDTVFMGTLPVAVDSDAELEDSAVINGTKYCYSVYVNVTDCPVFRLPDTGSSSDLLLTAVMIICYIMALGMAVWTKVKFKEKW